MGVEVLLSLLTAAAPATGTAPARSIPFGPGEELVFQIKALGVKSGTAQFNVGAPEEVDGHQTWPILMVARSTGLTDSLFPVRDRFVTFWDPLTELPVQGRLSASEGGKEHGLAIRFRRPTPESPARAEVMVSDARATTTSIEAMDPNAQDVQSAVYWLRTRPLKVGERDAIPVVAGKRQWTLRAEVIEQAPLETPAGHFDALRVEISTDFAGNLQSHRAVEAYFSADARHLPLRFDVDLQLGKMRAELVRYEVGETP